jgi:hypothetical protein
MKTVIVSSTAAVAFFFLVVLAAAASAGDISSLENVGAESFAEPAVCVAVG